jgi:hydrogenase maturation factor
MNLVTGEIVEIRKEPWMNLAKVRVNGAFFQVPLMFVPQARVGDRILVESGIAIAVVHEPSVGRA